MTLIASKAEYKPGETARLVPRTGLIKPTALVTLERNGVIESFVQEMESPYEGISVTDAWRSGAQCVLPALRWSRDDTAKAIDIVRSSKWVLVDLRVSAKAKELAVTVTTRARQIPTRRANSRSHQGSLRWPSRGRRSRGQCGRRRCPATDRIQNPEPVRQLLQELGPRRLTTGPTGIGSPGSTRPLAPIPMLAATQGKAKTLSVRSSSTAPFGNLPWSPTNAAKFVLSSTLPTTYRPFASWRWPPASVTNLARPTRE